MLTAFNLENKKYTTKELLTTLPFNISVQFTNNKNTDDYYITDAPEDYGIIEVKRGFSSNYNIALFYTSNKKTTWRYNYHATATTEVGWVQYLTNADLDNRFAVVGNNTAIQTVQATTMYRLQISTTGNLSMFKSIDGGKTWPQSKAVASFETT